MYEHFLETRAFSKFVNIFLKFTNILKTRTFSKIWEHFFKARTLFQNLWTFFENMNILNFTIILKTQIFFKNFRNMLFKSEHFFKIYEHFLKTRIFFKRCEHFFQPWTFFENPKHIFKIPKNFDSKHYLNFRIFEKEMEKGKQKR